MLHARACLCDDNKNGVVDDDDGDNDDDDGDDNKNDKITIARHTLYRHDSN